MLDHSSLHKILLELQFCQTKLGFQEFSEKLDQALPIMFLRKRIKDNYFYSFRQIEALDRNLRFNDPGLYCPKLYNTLCPIWD